MLLAPEENKGSICFLMNFSTSKQSMSMYTFVNTSFIIIIPIINFLNAHELNYITVNCYPLDNKQTQ